MRWRSTAAIAAFLLVLWTT